MIRKVLLLFAGTVLFSAVFAAEPESPSRTRQWNPFLAGTLSWYSAGLGQIYTEDYIKGGAFFLIDNALLILAVNAVANVDLVINENLGMNLNVSLKNKKDIEYNSAAATFFMVSFFAFHSYNVFDAVFSAAKKNLGSPIPVFRGKVQPVLDADGLKVAWRMAEY